MSCKTVTELPKKPGIREKVDGRTGLGCTAEELIKLNEVHIKNEMSISEKRQFVTNFIIQSRQDSKDLQERMECIAIERTLEELKSINVVLTEDELKLLIVCGGEHRLVWFEKCCLLHDEVISDYFMHAINAPNENKYLCTEKCSEIKTRKRKRRFFD